MRHIPRGNSPGLHVPQFLDSKAVTLRIDVVEFFLRNKLLGQRATRSLSQDGYFCAQFVAWGVVVFRVSVLVEAFVLGNDTSDSLAFIDERCSAKLREQIHSGLFYQPTQPLHNSVERDNVIALVLEGRGSERKPKGLTLGEQQRSVICHRGVQR